MGYFIGFLVIFLLIISVLLLFPVRLFISYKKDEDTNFSAIDIKYMFFRFRVHPSDKPKKPKEKKPKPEKKKLSFNEKKAELMRYIRIFNETKQDVISILDYATARAMVVEKVGIGIDFGFDDAMNTGIFTGLLNGFVYNVLGIIHNRANLEAMNVNIQPVFGNPCFKADIECIIRLRNVHIIIVAVNVLKLLRKMKKIKGGK